MADNNIFFKVLAELGQFKCFYILFLFPLRGGGSDPQWKIPLILFFLFLKPCLNGMKVNKFELGPFQLISLGARGDVTVWLKPNKSFELAPFYLISLGAKGDVTVWLKPNRSFVKIVIKIALCRSFKNLEKLMKILENICMQKLCEIQCKCYENQNVF